jgi:predicted DNA-binding transcriptional regulator AlpA
MPKQTYTTGEAASLIGISRQTLQAWISEPTFKAPKPVVLANMSVRIWTEADVERAKKFKGTLRRGPKPKKK